MNHSKELDFLLRFLKNHKIDAHFHDSSLEVSSLDYKIRQALGGTKEYTYMNYFLTHNIKTNTIYKITDQFSCEYFLLQLPAEEHTVPLIIGPYIHSNFDTDAMVQYIERYNLSPQTFQSLQEIFSQIPVLTDDTTLKVVMQTFGEMIWGSTNEFRFQYIDQHLEETIFTLLPEKAANEIYSSFDTQIYESYLLQENNLIQAVSQGNVQSAEESISVISAFPLSEASADQLRNMKNHALSMNCICRKTAELNTSNSYQVAKLSARFANKIELCASPEGCMALMREIARKYCLLIKNHSMREYSPLIQQAIRQVDMDLTADLSLNAMAKHLNSNASYLSAQFKKVTGTSYTEYVQKKRIEHAVLLLNTTSLQIQTIAQYCGIADLNYFSKLFKKYVHSSPTAYRKKLSKLEN